MPDRSKLFRITLLATGGTIEKTYDAHDGALTLAVPVIDDLLASLSHPDITIVSERLMARDSLDMDLADRARVVAAARAVLADNNTDAIVITHGTDTLAVTADALVEALAPVSIPILLTGAMRPFRVADSDAAQNVAQAIMAAQLAAPGVYSVMHGRLIAAGRIEKDYERLTFVEKPG